MVRNAMHDSKALPAAGVEMVTSDDEIASCFECMLELRPHLSREAFVADVRNQERESGYRMACIREGGRVVCVAGFRQARFLAWGRILYLDDLSTCSDARRRGHAGRMLDWLEAQARAGGCVAVHLDSGVQRFEAHRLYLAKRFDITSHHFARRL